MLAAPRKFSWENAFIDLSMADHDTAAAAAEEAKVAAEAVAAAEAVSGNSFMTGVAGLHCLSTLLVWCYAVADAN